MPALGFGVDDRPRDVDAGAVDEYVDTVVTVQGAIDQLRDLGIAANVSEHE